MSMPATGPMSMPRRLARRTPWRLAGAAERRLTLRMTRPLPPPVDSLLVMLTRSADRSVLWVALAGAFALVGEPRGQRAAHRGLLALAVTSATVNGPMKLLAGRQRPAPRRRLRHTPRTSSFPSGHSASAFAFVVAATRELPEAGPVLLPLAAGVAYSRVYLGVHYPSDVLAGGVFGTAVGMATRRRCETSTFTRAG
jgi:membrane-associated phospholipid phosphatase